MFPLRDSTPSQTFPVVTVVLIVVNAVIFLFEATLSLEQINQLVYVFGMVPANITNYSGIGYMSLFTSMFLHGSWAHVIGNMWILWLFGDNIEDRMGKFKFLLFYVICGLAAGVSHYCINPLSNIPVVGASGAVAGVMGAYFLMFRHARVLTFIPPFFLINIPAWVFLGFWVLSQLWCGAADLFSANACGQIAFWAHVGGFLAGMLLYRFFLKPETELLY